MGFNHLTVVLASRSMFGLMVIAFEMRWAKVENKMRRLFGFMYSPYGRTSFFILYVCVDPSLGLCFLTPFCSVLFCYVLFCSVLFCSVLCCAVLCCAVLCHAASAATLCWGIDLWLPIVVGIGTLINAVLQCFVFCQHPGFKEYSQVKKTDNPANLPEDVRVCLATARVRAAILVFRPHASVCVRARVYAPTGGHRVSASAPRGRRRRPGGWGGFFGTTTTGGSGAWHGCRCVHVKAGRVFVCLLAD